MRHLILLTVILIGVKYKIEVIRKCSMLEISWIKDEANGCLMEGIYERNATTKDR
jgi:hypothetical protein